MNNLLEKYVNNELLDSENEQVERGLIQEMFVQEKKQYWKARIAAEQQKDKAQQKSKLSIVWNANSIKAIAAILLIGLGFFFWQQNNAEDPMLLADVYLAKPFDNPETLRDNETDEVHWANAKAAYDYQQYEKAVEEIYQISTKNEDQKFYLGLSLIYQKKPDFLGASTLFKEIQNSEFKYDAKWFLALSYIKLNNYESAKIELQKIVDSGNQKSKEAKELLKAIDKK